MGQGDINLRRGWRAIFAALAFALVSMGTSLAEAQTCTIGRDVNAGTCVCPQGSAWVPTSNATCGVGRCACPTNAPMWTGRACTPCPSGQEWNGQSCVTTCQPGTQWNGRACVSICQPGTQWNGQSCVSVCQPGTQWNGRACASVCRAGETWNGSACVSMCPPGTRFSGNACASVCRDGQAWNGSACVSVCPQGTQWNGQTCVASCAAGTQWNGQSCVSICPVGTTWSGNQCVGSCQAGQQWNGQRCVSICPPGTTWDGNTCNWASNCGGGCGQGQVCVNNACVGTGDLRFTLTWDRPGDLDLRVVTPSNNEIYYNARSFDRGTLDRDDRTGTGPENVFWTSPPPTGTYLVCVDPYNISAQTNFTLMISSSSQPPRILNGTLAPSRTRQRGPSNCSRQSPHFVTEFVVGQGQPACPPGTTYNASARRCECGAGTQWNGLACVGSASSPTCPPGTTYSASTRRCQCPANQQWNGQSCVAFAPTCPQGTQWNGQMCAAAAPTCPQGLRWNGQHCIR